MIKRETKIKRMRQTRVLLTSLLVGSSRGRGVRSGVGLGRLLFYFVSALILTVAFLDAVKQPEQRHAVHVPLTSAFILLSCRQINTDSLDYTAQQQQNLIIGAHLLILNLKRL